MKINNIGASYAIKAYNKNPGAQRAKKYSIKQDTLEISSDALDMLSADESGRAARISSIARSISEGTYEVNLSGIADRMIANII